MFVIMKQNEGETTREFNLLSFITLSCFGTINYFLIRSSAEKTVSLAAFKNCTVVILLTSFLRQLHQVSRLLKVIFNNLFLKHKIVQEEHFTTISCCLDVKKKDV